MKREWQGCQLINAGCPDDLCVLPPNHAGTDTGHHLLETMAEVGQVCDPTDPNTPIRMVTDLPGITVDRATLVEAGMEWSKKIYGDYWGSHA